MKAKFLVTMIAGACLASLTTVSAVANTSGFGSIPGVAAGSNPYGGSGIPFNTSEYTQVTGIGAGSDTLTIALAATQYKANPAPGNDGAGTYTVGTGLVGGKSTWNFDFYGNSSLGQLANYVFTLTETANGHTVTFNPLTLPDNAGTAGTSFGYSERLDFAAFGAGLSYDPNANDTYDFDLSVVSAAGGPAIADTHITVNARAGAVPDAASTAMLLGFGFIGLALFGRRQMRLATVAK
ncbi:MAG TPA: hypothetical protein VN761_10325 [Candidatus Polarisedimenticolia bacterium]|nr:hypothetical protein [Candidatus Polarisedimenticolia bacterium]